VAQRAVDGSPPLCLQRNFLSALSAFRQRFMAPLPVHLGQAILRLDGSSAFRPGFFRPTGRSHYTVGQEGWEEVADYALDGAVENAKRPAA
jgi:hypothetical protein